MAEESDSRADVVVVGSSNTDLFFYVPRLPARGETLHGHSFTTGFGGKGGNQAVQAALLGASVALVACVGEDEFGASQLRNYESVGVDTTHVSRSDEAATGTAVITVDDGGDNNIVIVAGCNALLSAACVDKAAETIRGARVLLTQNEVPLATTAHALKLAAASERTFAIFNPAPAPAEGEVDDALLATVDLLTPNETEAALLTGMPVDGWEQAEAAAAALLARGCRAVAMTLGSRGCLLVQAGKEPLRVAAPAVDAVDSSGAGDSFSGALAAAMAAGASLEDAVRAAVGVASISVVSKGCQSSYPALDATGEMASSFIKAD